MIQRISMPTRLAFEYLAERSSVWEIEKAIIT